MENAKFTFRKRLFFSVFFFLFCRVVLSGDFELPRDPGRPRNYFFPPLISFILPGFDQYIESQYPHALFYSGAALGGASMALTAAASIEKRGGTSQLPHLELDNDYRFFSLGAQIYMAAGSFSAYHSFQSAAQTQKQNGRFLFLDKVDELSDLLLAPFDFSHAQRWETWLPLGLLGTLLVVEMKNENKTRSLKLDDLAFSGAFSYGAGTNEEALFRGYLQPLFHETYSGFSFGSNLSQAVLFALAHYPQVKFPIYQFSLGLYLGWLTERNRWSLSQAIFIHTWWDVMAFTAYYAYAKIHSQKIKMPLRLLNLSYAF